MNSYDTNSAPDARDFLGGYLRKEDVLEETEVRIVNVYQEDIAGEQRAKLVAQFAEFQKPMVLNSTNIKRLCKIFRTTNTAQWRGPVLLYVDHNIEFGGKTVGGLRVRSTQSNGEGLTAQKASRDQYQARNEYDSDEDFI
jgi:hypothetical protein